MSGSKLYTEAWKSRMTSSKFSMITIIKCFSAQFSRKLSGFAYWTIDSVYCENICEIYL